MRFNFKKKILRLVLWLILYSSWEHLYATQTRAAGLGLTPAASWVLSGLYPQVFLNPAYVQEQRSNFILEVTGNNPSGALLLPLGTQTLGLIYGDPANNTVLNRNDHPRGMFYDARTSSQGIVDNRFIDTAHYLRLNTAIVNSSGLALADSAQVYENTRNPISEKNLSLLYALPVGDFTMAVAFSFARSSDLQLRERGALSEELHLQKAELPVSFGVRHGSSRGTYRGVDISLRYAPYFLKNLYDERDLDGRRVLASLESDGARDIEMQGRLSISLISGHLFHLRGQYADLNSSTVARARAEINTGCAVITDCMFDLRDKYRRIGQMYSLGFSDEIYFNQDITWFVAFAAEWEDLNNSFDGEDLLNGGSRRDGTVYGNKAPVEQNFRSFVLPVYLGLEGRLSDSWVFRFGMNHSVVNRRSNSPGIQSYDETSRASRRASNGFTYQTIEFRRRGRAGALSNAAIGLSWQSPVISIDWLMNISFLTAGPNFISGAVNDLSLGIAFTYHFREGASGMQPQGEPDD